MKFKALRGLWVALVALVALGLAIWLLVVFFSFRTQAAILRGDPELILSNPSLSGPARVRGKAVYIRDCASCHGANGKGDASLGAPGFTNGVHLYGTGRVADIEEIVRHGIRSGDKRGFNLASMPAFASPRPYKVEPLPSLTPEQIEELTQYLLAFTGRAKNPAAGAKGAELYRDYAGCWDCHGKDAEGDASIGAPSLTHEIWLYGHGSHDDIYRSIARGRAGTSPAFERLLSAADLRDVAIYVASLEPAKTPK